MIGFRLTRRALYDAEQSFNVQDADFSILCALAAGWSLDDAEVSQAFNAACDPSTLTPETVKAALSRRIAESAHGLIVDINGYDGCAHDAR